mgnify:CR=1 FL=1
MSITPEPKPVPSAPNTVGEYLLEVFRELRVKPRNRRPFGDIQLSVAKQDEIACLADEWIRRSNFEITEINQALLEEVKTLTNTANTATGASKQPSCYAVFHGQGGYPDQNKRANETFVFGREYRITGGSTKKYSTSLSIEGFEGEWNSVLFGRHYSRDDV